MYSGYSDLHPPGPAYAPIMSSVPYPPHGYDSSLQPGSPQPLDLSIPRDDARRNSSYVSERSSAKTQSSNSVRYSPYRNQTPSPSSNIPQSSIPQSSSPSPRVIPRVSPAPYINHRNSPFSRATQGTESPYLYHELYTATNVLNEAPGGASSVPVSSVMSGMHRYEDRDLLNQACDILTQPVRRSNSPPTINASRSTLPEQTDPETQTQEAEDNQVIIMDLDPPTQNFQAKVNPTDQYNYKGQGPCFTNSQSKSFPSTSENKSPRVSAQAPPPFTQQFSPDSSSEPVSATNFSIRQSIASSVPPAAPASTSTISRPFPTPAAASKKHVSPSSSPKSGSNQSPDSPKTWFQNQSSACFMVKEQLLKLGKTQKTTMSDCLVNLMIADIKSCCRGIERFERDGVPKIRMPMYQLIETQVEEMIR